MNNESFKELVKFYENKHNKKGDKVNMKHLLIYQNEKYQTHAFEQNEWSDIRSISKTVMTLLFGRICMLHTDLSEETYIYPVIQNIAELTNEVNKEKLEKLQVKHLLTHTIGYDDVLLMRGDIQNKDPYSLVDYVINYPIAHNPGERYLYSNAGFYLLSVFLQEFLGQDLLEIADDIFFSELDIKDYYWEKYGNYLAGATRLWLYPEDLLKMGQLLLNKGQYQGKSFISEGWVEKMLVVRNETPDVDQEDVLFRRYGYGYGIWLAKESFYFGHGTDGQILLVVPDEDLIAITLAEEKDLHAIEAGMEKLLKNDFS